MTGYSGGVNTGVIGCRAHWSFNGTNPDVSQFCYVNGGAAANCPCTKHSEIFKGAAYKLCDSGLKLKYASYVMITFHAYFPDLTACSAIEIGGFTGTNTWANGVYTYNRDFVADDLSNCAYIPIYDGPVNSGSIATLVSFRPLSYVSAGYTGWIVLSLPQNVDCTIEISQLVSVLQTTVLDGSSSVNIYIKLFQSPLYALVIAIGQMANADSLNLWSLDDATRSQNFTVLETSSFGASSTINSLCVCPLPANLTIATLSLTSATIAFAMPPSGRTYAYTAIATPWYNSSLIAAEISWTRALNVALTGLEGGMQYNIVVQASASNSSNIREFVCGARSSVPLVLAMPAVAPTGVPTNLGVTFVSANEAVIKWDAPPPASWGSRNLSIFVHVNRKPNQIYSNNLLPNNRSFTIPYTSFTEAPANLQFNVTDLEPAVSYSISVSIQNAVGVGPLSANLDFTASDSG